MPVTRLVRCCACANARAFGRMKRETALLKVCARDGEHDAECRESCRGERTERTPRDDKPRAALVGLSLNKTGRGLFFIVIRLLQHSARPHKYGRVSCLGEGA